MLRGHTELRDDRVAVLVFDQFTLILDAAATDSVAAIGFNSADYGTDSPRWWRAAPSLREWDPTTLAALSHPG